MGNKKIIIGVLCAASVVSCSDHEADMREAGINPVFYASIEQPSKDEGTRVFVNQDYKVLWDEGDKVSIFNMKDANDEYRFTGKTGDNGGSFELVKDFSEEGVSIEHRYAVYPYSQSTSIDTKGTLSVSLPAEQYYREHSFGPGANMMVAATDSKEFQFKNVCGYLVLKLYGEGVSVSSITLKGNNGERLAGKAIVTMPLDGLPTATMSEDATTEITLECATPVQLGATADESVQFWFVLPPISFENGFTIIVHNQAGESAQSTTKALVIERNKVAKMAPLDLKSMTTYLSSSGTANCYIVNTSGWYCINAKYKGNSSTELVGAFDSVEVLWESFNTSEKPNVGDLIDDIKVGHDSLYFRVTDSFRPGNALICVKEESTILWSWHIWITDADIESSSHNYVTGQRIMDRNLGALSSEPGSVLSLGLLYQWGRKDPFLGCSAILADNKTAPEAESTNPRTEPVNGTPETGTIEYSIQHPMTPIEHAGNDSYDWLYPSGASFDDTRWTDNKTIYDPCPVGWQIPDESVWVDLFKKLSYTYSFIDNSLMDYQNRGIDLFNYSGIHCWFPLAGFGLGSLFSVGREGDWWTCTSYQSRASCLEVYYDADGLRIYPILKAYKSDGYSVRCVKQR